MVDNQKLKGSTERYYRILEFSKFYHIYNKTFTVMKKSELKAYIREEISDI